MSAKIVENEIFYLMKATRVFWAAQFSRYFPVKLNVSGDGWEISSDGRAVI